MLVEPLGETRLPASSLLDLSASKRFAVGRARDVTWIATVYNVLNETAPDGVITGNAGTSLIDAVGVAIAECCHKPHPQES